MIGNTNSAPIIEIKGGDCMSSYLTFVGNSANPDVDVVSAALGKGNEDEIKGVGKALAMYAKYKGETADFTELQRCNTLAEVRDNIACVQEWVNSLSLYSLISSNEYAFDLLTTLEVSSSITNKNGYSTPTTATKELVITQEYLSSGKPLLINGSVKHALANTISHGYIKINGVTLISHNNSTIEKKVLELMNLSEFGITEPGTYNVEMSLYSANPNYQSTASCYIYTLN